MVLSVKQSRKHFDTGLCCCPRCNSGLEFVDCGPGLTPKRVIDRLGRKSTRCVKSGDDTPTQGKGERHPELVPTPNPELDLRIRQSMKEAEGMKRGLSSLGIETPGISADGTSMSVVSLESSLNDIRNEFKEQKIGQDDRFNAGMAELLGGSGWRASSTGSRAQVIHAVVGRIFDGDSEIFDRYAKENPSGGVRAQTPAPEEVNRIVEQMQNSMDQEHAFWEEKLGEGASIRMYRGLRDVGDGEKPELGPNTIREFPASSWSISPEVAGRFGDNERFGTVVARDVPIDEIIASSFSHGLMLGELEFIIHTPPEGADVEVLM